MFGGDAYKIVGFIFVVLIVLGLLYMQPIADFVYYERYYKEDKGNDTYHLQNMAIAYMVLLAAFLILVGFITKSELENIYFHNYLIGIFLLVYTIFKIIHYVTHWNWNHEDEKIRDSFRASFVLTCLTSMASTSLFNKEED